MTVEMTQPEPSWIPPTTVNYRYESLIDKLVKLNKLEHKPDLMRYLLYSSNYLLQPIKVSD